jgi:hypothetical protein
VFIGRIIGHIVEIHGNFIRFIGDMPYDLVKRLYIFRGGSAVSQLCWGIYVDYNVIGSRGTEFVHLIKI